MIKLYQIGDMPIHFHAQGSQLWHGDEQESPGKSTDLLWSPEILWPDRQFVPRVHQVTVRGQLLYSGLKTPGEVYQGLKHLVGLPTDIIGYTLPSNPYLHCACDCPDREHPLVWLHNYGVLVSVDANETAASAPFSITLKIEFGPYWQPLNAYFWEWSSKGHDIFRDHPPTYPYQDGLHPFPQFDELFSNSHAGLRQFTKHAFADSIFVYDPAYWVAQVQKCGVDYPEVGVASGYGRNTNTTHEVNVSPYQWGAPPLSLYAFTHLPTSGTITLDVTRRAGVWDRRTDSTILDLAALHTALQEASLTGLLPGDEIIIGDVLEKPGLVIRDGAVLANIHPPVTYPGFWPGMVAPGQARVQITTPSTTVNVAWLHLYRQF